MAKDALVVKRNVLFKDGEFQGFSPINERDLISIILGNHYYHPRGDELENNHSLQQIIPYVWVVNSKSGKVLLYKRVVNSSKKEGEYVETRYLDNYSGGVGGHIDMDTEEGTDNPVERAMMRELREEIEMNVYPKPQIIGYLNDDSDSLGKVHLGVVAVALSEENAKIRGKEGLGEGVYYSSGEVDSLFENPKNKIENWTKMSWPFVKEYLNSLSEKSL